MPKTSLQLFLLPICVILLWELVVYTPVLSRQLLHVLQVKTIQPAVIYSMPKFLFNMRRKKTYTFLAIWSRSIMTKKMSYRESFSSLPGRLSNKNAVRDSEGMHLTLLFLPSWIFSQSPWINRWVVLTGLAVSKLEITADYGSFAGEVEMPTITTEKLPSM